MCTTAAIKLENQDMNNSEVKLDIKVEENERYIEESNSVKIESVILREMKRPIKRKKKLSKRTGEKRKKISERIRKSAQGYIISLPTSIAGRMPYRKHTTYSPEPFSSTSSLPPLDHDLKLFDILQRNMPMVYTKRLEEMSIWEKDFKLLDSASIINKILAESKPQYKHNVEISNTEPIRKMSFELLNVLLTNLKNKAKTSNAIIDLTEEVHNNDNVCIVTDVVKCNKHITPNVTDIPGGNNGFYKNIDVVLVIDNQFSNLRDVYAIDWKGKLVEYHCTKIDSNNPLNLKRIRKSKIRSLVACCWFHRNQIVETIWPSNKFLFSRFLKSTHKCPMDKCTCCCKPSTYSAEVFLHKPLVTNETEDFNIKSEEDENNIIIKALCYKTPEENINGEDNIGKKNSYTPCILPPDINFYLFKSDGSALKRLFFIDCSNKNPSLVRNEFYEIGNNHEIVSYHVETIWRVPWQRCKLCTYLQKMAGPMVHKLLICCKWKRDMWFHAAQVSANSIRFLRKNLFPTLCDNCRLQIEDKKNKSAFHSFLGNNQKIEHSKIVETSSVLKLDSKVKPANVDKSKVKNVINNINSCISNSPGNIDKQLSVVSKKIHVRCVQLPKFDLEISNLNIQEADMLVIKLRKMDVSVKEDLKVVGSFKSSMDTSSVKELQTFAQILQQIQNCLKISPVPPGLTLSLITESDRDHQTECANPSIETTNNNNFNDELQGFDSFEKFIRYSKTCYEKSFKSYVQYEHKIEKEDICLPKISSVFSLHKSSQSQIPSNEIASTPSTSSTIIPKPQPTLPLLLPTAGQHMTVCNPNTGQLFNLIRVDPVALENNLKQSAIPVPKIANINKSNLSPVEPALVDLNTVVTPTRILPIESESILPDIINDTVIVVKTETDIDVVTLDSD